MFGYYFGCCYFFYLIFGVWIAPGVTLVSTFCVLGLCLITGFVSLHNLARGSGLWLFSLVCWLLVRVLCLSFVKMRLLLFGYSFIFLVLRCLLFALNLVVCVCYRFVGFV